MATTVLLTGATGNLGAVILEYLLAQQYRVIAPIRSVAKHTPYFLRSYANDMAKGRLVLSEVPDMTVAGVFDDLAKDAQAIIHVATPLGDDDFLKTVIEPAWLIDENILSAATKSGTVKRVVMTGTIVAAMQVPQDLTADKVISPADFNPISLDEGVTSELNAYQYSKVSSEQKSWEFMGTHQPDFDLVVLLAPSITGRSIQSGFRATKKHLGGISGIYRELFDRERLGPVLPIFMDVDDVATIHLKSLDSALVPGNERYLFHAGALSGPKLANELREAYPELKGRVPAGGEEDEYFTSLVRLDTSKADKVFGQKWKGAWESVEATVKDILRSESEHGVEK